MAKQFIYVNGDGDYEQSSGAYEQSDFINTSAGAGDAGKPIVLDAAGQVPASMINDADIDHGALTGLGDDDHSQYTLADGTRDFSGKVSYDVHPTFTTDTEIVDKKYVDDEITANVVTDHGALTGLADDDHTQYILVAGTRAFTGDQSLGSNKITNLADGTVDSDAVNYGQLQAVQAGFDLKQSCRVATTTNLPSYTATGSQDTKTLTANANGNINSTGIDGITSLLVGDRVLVKNENGGQGSEGTDVDHGIYEITQLGDGSNPWILERVDDADGTPQGEVNTGLTTFIKEGDNNNNTGWSLITTGTITVDTTAIQFSQFIGVPSYTASDGVELVGVNFQLDLLASGGLAISSDEAYVNVDDLVGGSTEGITTVGSAPTKDLTLDWSTTFDDAKPVKAEDLNSTANGEGASIIGVEDTGGYYTGTDVEAVLQEIAPQLGTTVVSYTAGTGGVSKGDLVYISGNDTVTTYSNIQVAQAVIGIASTAASAGNPVDVYVNDAYVTGVLSGATAGTKYYWNGSGYTNNFGSFSSGDYIWIGGVSATATNFQTALQFIMKKA